MAVGGKGFVWFARAQTDTPGKLAATRRRRGGGPVGESGLRAVRRAV